MRSLSMQGLAAALLTLAGVFPAQAQSPGTEIEITPAPSQTPGVGALRLAPDLWRGFDPASLRRYLKELPRNLSSPILRDLARELLTAEARAANTSDQPALVAVRIQALRHLGLRSAAKVFIDTLSAGMRSDPVVAAASARLLVEESLIQQDTPTACNFVRSFLESRSAGLFWLQATILCQSLAQEEAKAEVTRALLQHYSASPRDAWQPGIPNFESLQDFLRTKTNTWPLSPRETMRPFAFAIARATGYPFEERNLDAAGSATLRRIATDSQMPASLRWLATERATAYAELPARFLRQSALSAPSAQTPQTPQAPQAQSSGDFSRKGLFGRFFRATTRPAQVQSLVELIAQMRRDSSLPPGLAARLLAPLFDDMTREIERQGFQDLSDDLLRLAPDAGRILEVAGKYEAAGVWQEVISAHLKDRSLAKSAGIRLWPYATLGKTPDEGWSSEWEQWKSLRQNLAQTAGSAPPDLKNTQHARDEEAWLGQVLAARAGTSENSDLSENGARPQAQALRKALAADARGETLLRVIGLLAPTAAGSWSAADLTLALAILNRLGLPLKARMLALEAADGRNL